MSVYFIQAGGPAGPIKIGVALDVTNRIRTLQVANHLELRLLAVIQGAKHGAEQQLHARFSADRIRGEWFRASEDLIDYIKGVDPSEIDRERHAVARGVAR